MQEQDFETYQKRFRDFEILLKFSKTDVFQGTIHHPSSCNGLVLLAILTPHYSPINPLR